MGPGSEANLTATLVIMGIMILLILYVGIVGWWQSCHCIFCGQRLPWKSEDFSCENPGRCNLERLALEAKKGNYRKFWGRSSAR